MSAETANSDLFKAKVLGHPAGLFVLFFTEMWERFSFYGMRVLLIQFLTAKVLFDDPFSGWGWSVEQAGALYGTYAMLLYLTPILGGVIADKYIGSRWAVIVGAIIMTIGHAAMGFDSKAMFFVGLACLVIGTGFFKPNMPSMLGEMYKYLPEKKDAAYTIFYMGVNSGAFFGMMLCGYLAETQGWHFGFTLAGIFMFLGTIQFWFAKPLFGTVGQLKKEEVKEEKTPQEIEEEKETKNPYTLVDYILIAVVSIIGLLYAFNDPLSKNDVFDLFKPLDTAVLRGQNLMAIIALIAFLYLVISRILRYGKIIRDRMFAVILLAFFLMFFFMSFEQGATSLVIFARDYTQRVLEGNSALLFNIFNTLLTVVPLLIISWVLVLLARTTIKKAFISNVVLAVTFISVWGAAIWMLNRNWNSHAYEVSYTAVERVVLDKNGDAKKDKEGKIVTEQVIVNSDYVLLEGEKLVNQTTSILDRRELSVGSDVHIFERTGKATITTPELEQKIADNPDKADELPAITQGKITEIKDNQVEVTVSWFSIMNSFFIIALASLVSKLWDSRYNPSAAFKYGIGLIFVAIGFLILGLASQAGEGVKLSMMFLILTYFFHTLGELFISPVGLSYVSKLVPGKMLAFMFGMWYLALAIAQKFAAILGGQIEVIKEEYSLSHFFFLFTLIPLSAGILVMLVNPLLKKLMHGVR